MKSAFITRLFASTLLLASSALAAACSAADPQTAGESAEDGEHVADLEQAGMGPIHLLCQIQCKTTTSCSTSCIGQGTCGAYGVCAQADPDADGVPSQNDNCPNNYNPNQANCDGDTLGDACETDPGRYVLVGPTFAICHFDRDTHIDGVDVEIYTVDRYRDTSCLQLPDGYRKRALGSVHCGFHSSGTCEGRVTARVTELVAQGYVPITASESDECPHPRVSDAALAPLPRPNPPRPPRGPIP